MLSYQQIKNDIHLITHFLVVDHDYADLKQMGHEVPITDFWFLLLSYRYSKSIEDGRAQCSHMTPHGWSPSTTMHEEETRLPTKIVFCLNMRIFH